MTMNASNAAPASAAPASAAPVSAAPVSAAGASARQRVREFAEMVYRRCDGVDEVVPAGYKPDYTDMPSRYRVYPGRARIVLAGPMQMQARYSAAARAGARPAPTLDELASLLYLTLAPLRRKLDITWNASAPEIGFRTQEFGRGSASGGGLYPTQAYVVAGAGSAPGAGVYHYCVADHTLVPLRHGSVEPALSVALGLSARYPYYLVLAPDFWTNCVKYHNFGMHVCSQDSGAMLATLQVACDALGIAQRSFSLFDDARMNALIGADGHHESSFVVVGLGAPLADGAGAPAMAPLVPAPLVPAPCAWQKSRHVSIAPMLSEIHALTMLESSELGALLDGVTTAPWRMPDAAARIEAILRAALPAVLHARRSAWGSLYAAEPVTLAQLLALLAFVWRRAAPEHGALREALPEGAVGLVVQINRAHELPRGAYRYDGAGAVLEPIASSAPPTWQDTYAWYNYNIDEAACVIYVTGNLHAVMERYGARGYRVLNACVGMLAQLCYIGASALRLDCGAVLGARAQYLKRTFNLPAEQNVCMTVYLSQPQAPMHMFDFSLIPDVPNWKSPV